MKTKTKILTACVVALAAFAACKKTINPSDMSEQQTTEVEQTGYQRIRQKTYDLSLEQTNQIVQNFKATQNNTTNAQAKLIDADSVALDSSIFVLEAALNFDFDLENEDNYERTTITSQFTIPIDEQAQKVLSRDLENVYTELTNFIIANTTIDIKAQIVDVEGYITSANKVTYKAEVVTFNKTQSNYCGGIANNASPYLSIYQSNAPCSGYPNYDATTLMNQKMNCPNPLEVFCAQGTYYSNVISYNTPSGYSKNNWNAMNNTTATFLFYSGANTAAGHCAASYKTLTSTQLDNYLAAAKTEIAANLPAPNMKVVSAGHIPLNATITGGTSTIIYWQMYATYGVKHCLNVVKNPPYHDPS